MAVGLVMACGCVWGQDVQSKQGGNDDPTRRAAVNGASHQTVAKLAYPVSLFYSTGDAIVEYKWMPMDSKETINAAFDILVKRYNCDRILWRDTSIAWVERFDRIRNDSLLLGKLMSDAIRISRNYRTTEYAEQAARAREMQFWGIWSLFDYCGKAECGAGGGENLGSFWGSDLWLDQHPEYRLWDRAHITYMTGIIEYGYPEVRKEYLRRMEEMFKGPLKNFDGLFVYSFIEHFEAHYTDEYIYSGIACEEYKKRYGVDPRTQPFDLDKYYALRGEYITQYLRDLRPLFQKYHKKLAMGLNPFNMEWPQRWIHGQSDILQQGRVKMDWRTWVKEGLVDELYVWGGAEPNQKFVDVQELLKVTTGTPVRVTVCMGYEFPETKEAFYAAGMQHVISVSPGNEEGYTEKRPTTDINSHDPDAVLKVLTQLRNKSVTAPLEQITALLLEHPNPMVRRQAANTLGTLKLEAGVPALEQAAINESEPSVKAMVFDALGKVNGPNSVATMAQGFGKVNTWPVRMALRDALSKMGPERFDDIVKAYNTNDSYFRIVLFQGLERKAGNRDEYGTLIKRAVLDDPNEQVRWWAAYALGRGRYVSEDAVEVQYKAMDDKSDTVQSRAATSLKNMMGYSSISPELKQRVFDKLMAKYQEFGAGCKRTDCDWGWRPIGETIRDGFGDKGKNAMLDILNSKNTELAQLTWRVFFQPNEAIWCPIDREDMERRYRFYPGGADHGKCLLVDVAAALKKP